MGILDKITSSVYVIAIILVLVIISIACFIFFPKGRNFFEINKTFPDLKGINNNIEIIRKELQNLPDNTNVPLYYQGHIHTNLWQMPNMYLFLSSIEGLRAAQIIKLAAEEETKKIHGYADLSNNTLRCQFPLIPSGSKKTGIWVDGETKLYRDNEWLIFDYSRENFNLNKHMTKAATILVLDIDRPKNIAVGISQNNNKDDINHLILSI